MKLLQKSIVIVALVLAAFQTSEVGAISRLKVDATFEVGMVSLSSSTLTQAASLAMYTSTSEKKASDILIKDLSSAESAMRSAALHVTTAKALEVVGKRFPAKITALIELQSGEKQKGYGEVQKGQDMLNEMIKEALEKLDLERQTCYTFIKSQTHQIWLTVQDIRMYDARAAGAREDVLEAQTEIARLSVLLPQLTQTLKQHNEKCAVDIASLEAQLKIVLGDINVMSNVLKLTECKASLLMTHTSMIHSKATQRLLQQHFDEACGDDNIPLERYSWSGNPNGEALVQVSKETAHQDPNKVKQRAKCTLSKKSCTRLRDKFLQIQSGISAKRDELMAELNALRRHCADEKANLESQISDAETDLKSWQTALAKATKEQNDAERNSKIKNEERVALIKELIRMVKLCHININNYISEECALGKIRGELEQMKGHTNPAFIQDCEVTDWSGEECSVSCAGGTQKLTRAISVHPVGGATCPPLEMTRQCNEDPCPIDCEVGDWSEWGDCSAECNGGVKQKIRNVVTGAQYGGTSCGETSVAESCNLQSCDVDCNLGDWNGWSVCSKECDGGLSSRVKNVVESEKGAGKCAKRSDDSRLEFMPCNENACKGQVTCKAELDVILVLDGSGSLRSTGWDQTKKFGEMFIKAMTGGEDNVKLSVILFSGPRTWNQAQLCAGTAKGATPTMEECGIQIVQHFSTDMTKAADVVKGLTWPRATTLTSQALMAAKSELALGRKDASSVVIVVTDGRPMNRVRTAMAAKDLRQSARLMWIPVTKYVPMADVREWASKPASENIIKLDDFWAMTDPETISNIVADMCPKVSQTDCWVTIDCPSGMTKTSDGTACADSTGKACDLGYCAGTPNRGVESCSTGPISKETLFGTNLGHECWNRFPCPAGSLRSAGDASVCEAAADGKRCDLAYCNGSPNIDMLPCSTGPDTPTEAPTA